MCKTPNDANRDYWKKFGSKIHVKFRHRKLSARFHLTRRGLGADDRIVEEDCPRPVGVRALLERSEFFNLSLVGQFRANSSHSPTAEPAAALPTARRRS